MMTKTMAATRSASMKTSRFSSGSCRELACEAMLSLGAWNEGAFTLPAGRKRALMHIKR
jgi:hypothetical protein